MKVLSRGAITVFVLALILAMLPVSVFAENEGYHRNLLIETASGEGNGSIVFMRGDLDKDGDIDDDDRGILLGLMSHNLDATDEYRWLGDFNDDRLFDLLDLNVLNSLIAGSANNTPLYVLESVPAPGFAVSAITYEGQTVALPQEAGASKITVINGSHIAVTLHADASVTISGIPAGTSGVQQTIQFDFSKSEQDVYHKNLSVTSDKGGKAAVVLMRGDLDKDGDVDDDDVLAVKGLMAQAPGKATEEQKLLGDLNHDGIFDLADLMMVQGIVNNAATGIPVYVVENQVQDGYRLSGILYNGAKLDLPNEGDQAITTIDGNSLTVKWLSGSQFEVSGIPAGTSGVEQTLAFSHEGVSGGAVNDAGTASQNPKTSDSVPVVLIVSLVVLSAAGVILLVVLKKKKDK